MGGTLPALLRALRPGDDAVPQATGLLYGANTIGAVLGTLATPFVLVPALGITLSALLASLLGLAVAAAALALDRRASALHATPPAPARSRRPPTPGSRSRSTPSPAGSRSATRSSGPSCSCRS